MPKINFLGICDVAYQIKGNETYNNMLDSILPLHTPLAHGVGSKVIFSFLKVVLVYIKLMGMKHRTLCKPNILPIYTPSSPRWGQILNGKKCRTLCK